MKAAICFFLLALVTVSKADRDFNPTDDKLVDALIVRFNQLEEKFEAREKVHSAHIAKQTGRINELEVREKLHHAQITRQTERINELEAQVCRQNDQINGDLTSEWPSKSEEQEIITGNTSTPVKLERSVNLKNPGIRQVDYEHGIAFFATLSANIAHLGTNQTIVFDRVVTNIGNGYHSHVGVFIAPVTGTYVFSVTLMTTGRYVARYAVYRNSEWVSSLYVNGAENQYDTTSQTAVLHVDKDDDVTIKHKGSDHTINGDAYSVFSGFLLSESDVDSSAVLVGK